MWGSAPAYKITKAALSMLTYQYALEYEKEGFTIFQVSPGVCCISHSEKMCKKNCWLIWCANAVVEDRFGRRERGLGA
jgi:NAD(P)-dependent dehydrogenase (short-subunit alcohol dehydrogenase family)